MATEKNKSGGIQTMMPHGKTLLVGLCGIVKGRLGWAHGAAVQLHSEFEPIIAKNNWLEGAPFDTIHYVVRFGAEALDEIYFIRVNKKYQELEIASQLSMKDLHVVFLDKPRLKEYLKREFIRVLIGVKEKYQLSELPELGI